VAALAPFQGEIIRKLAGGEELAPGVTLTERRSEESRAQAASYLAGVLESLGLEPQRQPYESQRGAGENVFALLPSTTGSQEYVVVGAHYDGVGPRPGGPIPEGTPFPAANDNATGCAAVLGVARHLVSLPTRIRNVYVVLFDQEERGLVGAGAFAEKLLEEGKAVVAVHTIDQLGWDEDGDGALELEVPYEGAVELYRRAAEAAGFHGTIHVTEETGSDHSAFRRRGFPAVGITEEYRNGDTTPHIHRPTDTWETVSFEYLARGTILIRTAVGLLVGGGG
jgi:Zn-dependent M28 family amino/carboxypeptidase